MIIFTDLGHEHPITYEWIKFVNACFPTKFKILHSYLPNTINHHPPICTKKYKVEPVRRYLKNRNINQAIKYLGFSYEEKKRAKGNSIVWIEHKFPLVELKWTRKDCTDYLLENFGFVPPRSGCQICKYNKILIPKNYEK